MKVRFDYQEICYPVILIVDFKVQIEVFLHTK